VSSREELSYGVPLQWDASLYRSHHPAELLPESTTDVDSWCALLGLQIERACFVCVQCTLSPFDDRNDIFISLEASLVEEHSVAARLSRRDDRLPV
jgi:hypothetical protein